MSEDRRDYRNAINEWNKFVPFTYEGLNVAISLRILEELQKLNRVFECPNFLAVPRLLREIQRNTTKSKRRKR